MITPPRAADGALILADIGGYTSFLRSVQVAHAEDAFADGNVPPAYELVSSLLDGIVGSLIPPFTLSKLEGDAVFAYAAPAELLPRGEDLRACIDACHGEFHRRLGRASEVWTCRCDACSRIHQLDLKFILHAGAFVIQSIAGADELVGAEVIAAHRLLKSDAATVVGSRAYALLTAAAVERFGMPTAGAVPMVVDVEHYEPIATWLYRLSDA